jgi:dimethylhistidine N-methyltransferase
VNERIEIHDLHPSRKAIEADVLAGLSQPQKWIAPMYFYDARGSELFDRICELPEYYPTRTELSILAEHGADIAGVLGPRVMLIEPGSGSGEKARALLEWLDDPVAFVPVEISREHLEHAAAALDDAFPDVEVLPVCADFSRPFELPPTRRPARRRVLFFPGSTIGNFAPRRAVELLVNFASVVGKGGAILVGADLRKDRETLERAYNDAEGVTAQFNLNVLERLNRELDAGFETGAFVHRAVWNEADSRIEMHLVSERDQHARIGGQRIDIAAGEYIHTESSYKYSLEGFAALAQNAGLAVMQVWTDPDRMFSLQLLEPGKARR